MRCLLASLVIFAALICSSNALTEEQIINQITNYCTSLGYQAEVSKLADTDSGFWIRIEITVPNQMELDRGKELIDQVIQYASGFDEVYQLSVYAFRDDGSGTLAWSGWSR
jgi:hypothetical protein